ncbi:hypothetical protein LZC95_06390 [Pendulispora brunnea]|uniref:PEGA domain-containing protein n=1 Tax=Pendulispora brunnea TaxID=2905690 RepID=A0ABZ2KCQ0_9BACT
MKPFRSFAGALILASLLGSHGADAEPLTRAQKDAAEHNKRAFEAVRRADAETARVEFLQAYALVPSPKALWNLLVAEADSNHPLDALKHLRAYLADPSADPKKKDRAEHLLTELTAQVGHLNIVAPDNAPVRVDGLVLTSEQRSQGVDVAPGKHVIEATIGDEPQRREVDVAVGDPTLVAFESPRKEEPAVEAPAPVAPVSPPQTKLAMAPVRVPSRGIGSPPLGTWIMGSVAVAALGTGIAFSLSAKSKRDEIDESPRACANPSSSECAHIEDLRDSGSRDSTIAWIAYGTAGASVITGGLLWYFSPKRAASRDATIVPLVSPGMAGVHLRGTF